MPYITQESREQLDVEFKNPTNPGELNYLFTLIASEYLGTELNYQKLNDVIGALEGCKLELYRRLAAPYEDAKILINGDVF